MNYCGFDIAMKSSYLYVSDSQGQKLGQGEIPTEKDAIEKKLKPFLRDGLKVAIEAGGMTAWVHDALVELGAEVVVVNPNKVKAIAESRKKTDKIDAKLLCELLRLEGLPQPVHMPGPETRSLRGLLVGRRQLVTMRVRTANVVRGLLKQEGVRLERGTLMTFKGWEGLLARKFKHTHFKPILAAFYDTFQAITRSIQTLEKELAERERNDKSVARLKTIPKVGRIGALTFLAAVDDVKRFGSARKLVGYTGLAPTVRSSGERTQYGSITRQGRPELRAVWVQIAHLVAADQEKRSAPLRKWYKRIEIRRGKRTAVVALARKLLTIAYRVLWDESVYDARRFKRPA